MSFIEEHRSRTNRNLLILGIVVTAATATTFFAFRNYYRNFALGPFVVDDAVLAKIDDVENAKNRFVTFTGGAEMDTGMQKVTETRSKYSNKVEKSEVTGKFMAVKVGEHALLVEMDPGHQGKQYTGELVPLPSEVRSQFLEPLAKDDTDLHAMFLPFGMDAASSYRTGGWVGLALGLPTLLFGLICISRSSRRMGDATAHPITQTLALSGVAADLARQIDSELAGPGVTRIGTAIVTPSWVMQPYAFGLYLAHLDDVVWAYGHITQHKTNGIKTHRQIEFRLHDRRGAQVNLSCRRDEDLKEMLAKIDANAPWVILGHDEKIAALWKKDKTLVVAASDARKKNPIQNVVEVAG